MNATSLTTGASNGTATDNWGNNTVGGFYVIVDDPPPDQWRSSEKFLEWKRRKSAGHARDQRARFENPFASYSDTRYAKPSTHARFLTGRRTREGRARNAVRQLPMLGAA